MLAAGSEPDISREGVMVMDMGLHAIPTLVEPQQMIQVLVPGVEERARHLPPLATFGRLMPGTPFCMLPHLPICVHMPYACYQGPCVAIYTCCQHKLFRQAMQASQQVCLHLGTVINGMCFATQHMLQSTCCCTTTHTKSSCFRALARTSTCQE